MRETRRRRVEGRDDIHLARGVHHVVVPANDMGNVHVQVIDDDAEVVGRHPIGTRNHEIVELAVVERDRSANEVVEHDLAIERILEADHRLDIGRWRIDAAAASSVVAWLVPACSLGCPHRIELVPTAVAAVRLVLSQKTLDMFLVERQSVRLKVRPFIGNEIEPAKSLHDRVDRRRCRSLAVGILDTEHEGAAAGTREQPAEQGRPGAADVQEPGRARSEPGANIHALHLISRRPARPAMRRRGRVAGTSELD